QQLSFWYPGRPLFAGWCHAFPGGLTWVRGENGSGKSTLLRLLGGALQPVAGTLTVDGLEATAQPQDYRRQVFWCGPDPLAFDHLSPAEYWGFLAGLYPTLDGAALPDQAQALGLGPHLHKRIEQLSTGTQRKVALAAALCANTRVVLLDEPLAALDAASVARVRSRLALAAADATRCWIVTSHEALGEAAQAHAALLDLPMPA
ncbi:MAG: ABC transporter, partial [Burkholderiales bacterium PBB5]